MKRRTSDINMKSNFTSTTKDSFKDSRRLSMDLSSNQDSNNIFKGLLKEQRFPFPSQSSYKKCFVDWGKRKHVIEKTPQFPVYSMSFKGRSTYKDQCQKSEHLIKDFY